MTNSRIIDEYDDMCKIVRMNSVPVAYDEQGTIKELFRCITQDKPVSKDLAISALHWIVKEIPEVKSQEVEFCSVCHDYSNKIISLVCNAKITEGNHVQTDSCSLKGVLLAFIKLTTWQPDPYKTNELFEFVKAAVSDCDNIKNRFIAKHGN